MTQLIDTNVSLLGSDDDCVLYSQVIPDSFTDDIQNRFTGANDKTGEFLFVGSVPTAVVDRWLREGFDVYRAPIRETLAKLRAENMGRFIGTSKRI